MMRLVWVYKPWWLTHVYLFSKMALQESIVYIKLTDLPITVYCYAKNRPDGSGFNHRTKRVREVYSSSLMISFSDQSGFVLFQGTISIVLQSVHPTTTNNIHMRLEGNQIPCVISDLRVELRAHRSPPLAIFHCLLPCIGFTMC